MVSGIVLACGVQHDIVGTCSPLSRSWLELRSEKNARAAIVAAAVVGDWWWLLLITRQLKVVTNKVKLEPENGRTERITLACVVTGRFVSRSTGYQPYR